MLVLVSRSLTVKNGGTRVVLVFFFPAVSIVRGRGGSVNYHLEFRFSLQIVPGGG